jgi:hypothetical protein
MEYVASVLKGMVHNGGNKKRKGLETASLSTDTALVNSTPLQLQITPFCFLLRVICRFLLIVKLLKQII